MLLWLVIIVTVDVIVQKMQHVNVQKIVHADVRRVENAPAKRIVHAVVMKNVRKIVHADAGMAKNAHAKKTVTVIPKNLNYLNLKNVIVLNNTLIDKNLFSS